MIVYKLRNKTFPKTCSACRLFCRTFGVPAYCKVGGKYTEKEIESEKDGTLSMYYHGCLNKRPKNCGDCPCCIYTADEKRAIGYCNTSNDDYYCKVLDRFMEYDKVDGGVDILGKPFDCPLKGGKR